MKSAALVKVGPPPALISTVAFLPTLRNSIIMGTAVGNIMATIPTVQVEANNANAGKSN